MIHIISNTGFPSLSRNHARQNGIWQTFDGLSYTCKIGNFIYDWVVEASGKVFLAVQSPTPTFSYKSYATGECDYFGVQFGTGDSKESKLNNELPTNYPDPCLFNANWQGIDIDGSMISWISNENNTGVSSSTSVMVGGEFYDLGRPILGAAVNEGFILAIHCDAGVAVFCEYSTKDGVIKKRFEEEISKEIPIDSNEIARLNGVIADLDNPTAEEVTAKKAYDAKLEENKTAWEALYHVPYDVKDDFHNYLYRANGAPELFDEMDNVSYRLNGCSVYQLVAKKRLLKALITSKIKGIQEKYCVDNYRASFSPDLTAMLLHIGFKNGGRYSNNKLNFNSSISVAECFGFATFDLKITWINEEEIKNAIKNKITPIPEKKFTYKIKHLKSKYFDECKMFFWEGVDDDDIHSGDSKLPYNDGNIIHYDFKEKAVMRGKLKSDNAFIFAELVGNKPVWLSAKIDNEMVSGFTYRLRTFTGSTFGWHEVIG